MLCNWEGNHIVYCTTPNGSYRPVDDLIVTCWLTACTLGSALDPMRGNEYGKPLPFYPFTFSPSDRALTYDRQTDG